jgi:hypothetical protein
MLHIISKTMVIFHKELKNNLELLHFDIDITNPMSFCVNPYIGIIKSIMMP